MPYKDPEKRREQSRRYRTEHRAELNAYSAAWRRRRYAEDPDYRRKIQAIQAAQPNAVTACRAATYRAIKRGQLTRPETCEKCGSGGAIEAAHYDYSDPLHVRWLCRSCHRAWDVEQPKVQAGERVRGLPRGEAKANARLTDAAVRLIRSSDRTLASLADELGVSIKTVHNVRTGKTWRHVLMAG